MQFKIGDWVKPVLFDEKIPPYEVKAIFSDCFGLVLLREVDGSGYNAQYCKKVLHTTCTDNRHGATDCITGNVSTFRISNLP